MDMNKPRNFHTIETSRRSKQKIKKARKSDSGDIFVIDFEVRVGMNRRNKRAGQARNSNEDLSHDMYNMK